jgi:hypothetical protein
MWGTHGAHARALIEALRKETTWGRPPSSTSVMTTDLARMPEFLEPPGIVAPTRGDVGPADRIEWSFGEAERDDESLTSWIAIAADESRRPVEHIVYAAHGVTRVQLPEPPAGVTAEPVYGVHSIGDVAVSSSDERLAYPTWARIAWTGPFIVEP